MSSDNNAIAEFIIISQYGANAEETAKESRPCPAKFHVAVCALIANWRRRQPIGGVGRFPVASWYAAPVEHLQLAYTTKLERLCAFDDVAVRRRLSTSIDRNTRQPGILKWQKAC